MRREVVWLLALAMAATAVHGQPGADSGASSTRGTMAAGKNADVAGTPIDSWRVVEPDYQWSFPRDHGTHPGFRNEWWYFVGHLADPSGRRFGYQLTLFRIGIAPRAPELQSAWTASDLVMGHLAVTDVESGRHLFAEALYRATPRLGGFGGPDSIVAWCQAPPGTDGRWSIRWSGRFELSARDERTGVALQLTASPLREPMLQGPNGYSRKSDTEAAASHYYSVTRLETHGIITVPGVATDATDAGATGSAVTRDSGDVAGFPAATFDVTGTSWMDHEFSSNQLGQSQVGWDWFALQLDAGQDIMLYMLRNAAGIDYAHGTIRNGDGSVQWLAPGDWSLHARGQRGRYPSRWSLRIADRDLEIVPLVLDQENVSAIIPGLRYWEGAVEVRVEGKRSGQGYVELTGYGDSGRLPF